MNKVIIILLCFLAANCCMAQKKQETVAITFEFVCKEDSNVLNNKLTNNFGETYTITKLKYYISHVNFSSRLKQKNDAAVYLIDASKKNRISISLPDENTTGFSFLLGMDSLLNCSGAQSGALDPLNDMFWTWNNGYIVFKLEGTSPSSTADLQRIEHHIGGYKGDNKTMREVFLPINNKSWLKTKTLTVQLDVNKYWQNTNNILIKETPLITLPSAAARNAADQVAASFSIKENELY
ncbi:MAG: MbnP family protein [Ferruginibacter sp.]